MLREIAAITLGVLGVLVPFAIPREDDDDDLAWVEREIRRCEDGPRSIHQDTPEATKVRNETLERLYALRKKLMGEAA